MENVYGQSNEDDQQQMELPPGFRFHPTDEELITHYLSPKVLDTSFSARAIGEVDLNKSEPWELPLRAKMGEKEWYFFCLRDRKYPTGLRTNRATEAGYWKATGKDKEIYKMKTLVGMKKTLVFYKGRAPKGEKSNWVMHEYRLEGKYSIHNLPKSAKNEWVICRVFQKVLGGKKTPISGFMRLTSYVEDEELHSSHLPPLMDSTPYNNYDTARATTQGDNTSHVTCFSNPMETHKFQEDTTILASSTNLPTDTSSASMLFSKFSLQNSLYASQIMPNIENLHHPDSVFLQDQSSILRFLLENQGFNMNMDMNRNTKTEFSQETGMSTTDISSVLSNHEMGQRSFDDHDDPCSSAAPVDIDCLWNY